MNWSGRPIPKAVGSVWKHQSRAQILCLGDQSEDLDCQVPPRNPITGLCACLAVAGCFDSLAFGISVLVRALAQADRGKKRDSLAFFSRPSILR
jgi:hypothetical protein